MLVYEPRYWATSLKAPQLFLTNKFPLTELKSSRLCNEKIYWSTNPSQPVINILLLTDSLNQTIPPCPGLLVHGPVGHADNMDTDFLLFLLEKHLLPQKTTSLSNKEMKPFTL